MDKLCRGCDARMNKNPILHFKNMPDGAQKFLTERELCNDKGTHLKLYQCPYCGLIQIIDEPVQYYKDVIRASSVSENLKKYRLTFFKQFLEKYNLLGKKIVEIGCGKGEFLSLMSLAGAETYGIEHNIQFVKECRKKGLNVAEGFIDDNNYEIKERLFDGFYMMNFLEHIPQPKVLLKGIYNNVKDKGIGLVEVPNFNMILKENMFSELIHDHLMYFTQKTLTHLLESTGFEILECENVWQDYVISVIVRKRENVNLQVFEQKLSSVATTLNEYIDVLKKKNKKIAVWGASHQALAVLALSGIQNKIEFVVDSAVFKQNKFTPGTHLKVLAPEKILSYNINAVIVMAASFSDEVVEILQNKYPSIEVAVLRGNDLQILN